MGGTSANRITNFDGDVLGQAGGEENHDLIDAEMPTHTHVQNPHTHSYTRGNTDGSGASAGVLGANYGGGISTETGAINAETPTNQSAGGGDPHNNLQPTIICNYIIKL
jgi:microcystin-dependent protein